MGRREIFSLQGGVRSGKLERKEYHDIKYIIGKLNLAGVKTTKAKSNLKHISVFHIFNTEGII